MISLNEEEIERILYWYEVAFDEGLTGDDLDEIILDKLEEESKRLSGGI